MTNGYIWLPLWKFTEDKRCYDFVCNLRLKHFILKIIRSYTVINVCKSTRKVPVVLVGF